jgi:hypothetical protein
VSAVWDANSSPEDAESFMVNCHRQCQVRGINLYTALPGVLPAGGVTWLHSIVGTSLNPTMPFEAFMEQWRLWAAGMVRDQYSITLEQLAHGKLYQGRDTVDAYVSRFRQASNILRDTAPRILCQWFLRGLNADLRARCLVTPSFAEWTDIQALMAFASLEARRLQVASGPGAQRPGFRPSRPPSRSQVDNQGFKAVGKRPSDAAAAGASAAERPSKRQTPSGGAGPSSSGPSSSAGYSYDNPPPNAIPPRLHPLFRQTCPLTLEQSQDLRSNFICTYCREARHDKSVCPKRIANEQRKGKGKQSSGSGTGAPKRK